MSVLEDCLREDLNVRAERRIAVLDPVKLVIDNYPGDAEEECFTPNHPQRPELGKRSAPFSRELWIERDDYEENPKKGYFRLTPGTEVRLRYAFIVKCVGADKDEEGNVIAVHCTYDPDTKSGTPGSESRKVKGNIHWVSVRHARTAEVRLYDRLFISAQPGQGRDAGADEMSAHAKETIAPEGEPVVDDAERSYLDDLNPHAKRVITAFVEPLLADVAPESRYQFERHGYFVADLRDSRPGKPVFNRAVTLRDSWAKQPG